MAESIKEKIITILIGSIITALIGTQATRKLSLQSKADKAEVATLETRLNKRIDEVGVDLKDYKAEQQNKHASTENSITYLTGKTDQIYLLLLEMNNKEK